MKIHLLNPQDTQRGAELESLLRQLGATEEFKRSPEWPVLGPPQGIEVDIWPLGEPVVHDPVYTHTSN